MMADVYLALGSSLNSEANLRQALRLLRTSYETVAVSGVYRTAGEGSGAGFDFLNAALHLRTNLAPVELKQALRALEAQMGRVRDGSSAAHPIDLDIVLWGEESFEYGAKPWRVPDPAILRAAYVAVPLAEIAPDLPYPGDGRTLAQIAAALAGARIERIAFEWDAA